MCRLHADADAYTAPNSHTFSHADNDSEFHAATKPNLFVDADQFANCYINPPTDIGADTDCDFVTTANT